MEQAKKAQMGIEQDIMYTWEAFKEQEIIKLTWSNKVFSVILDEKKMRSRAQQPQ